MQWEGRVAAVGVRTAPNEAKLVSLHVMSSCVTCAGSQLSLAGQLEVGFGHPQVGSSVLMLLCTTLTHWCTEFFTLLCPSPLPLPSLWPFALLACQQVDVTLNLRVLCDMALAIAQHIVARQRSVPVEDVVRDLAPYPGQVPLPTKMYRLSRDAAEKAQGAPGALRAQRLSVRVCVSAW